MRKMTIVAGCLAAVTVMPPAAAKDTAPPYDYGPPPDWQRFRDLTEAALRARLVDPDSAKIGWPNGYQKGGFKPMLSKRVFGYTTCGTVNSRNRMGGYAGEKPFVVVIDFDQVRYIEVSENRTGILATICAGAALPPPAEMPNASAAKSGFDLTAVPDGAYVSTVATGGAAERAGLKPGMVVSHVNGMTIRGMDLMLVRQLLERSEGKAKLTIIGGSTVEVDAAAPVPAAPAAKGGA